MPVTAYNHVPIPSFMYGTAWKKEATTQLVQSAVAAGFRAIDTANQLIHYQEALVGDALQALAKNGIARDRDRKSTRLNSSHGYISYAVFCLKKKKTKKSKLARSNKISPWYHRNQILCTRRDATHMVEQSDPNYAK